MGDLDKDGSLIIKLNLVNCKRRCISDKGGLVRKQWWVFVSKIRDIIQVLKSGRIPKI